MQTKSDTHNLRDLWREAGNPFHRAILPGVGFELAYLGKRTGQTLDGEWTATDQPAEHGQQTTCFTHATGLEVRRTSRLYANYHAAEFQLDFKNRGITPLAAISGIHNLSLQFAGAVAREASVLSSTGAYSDGYFPPRSFELRQSQFDPSLPTSTALELSADGGRSSKGSLPIFFVHSKEHRAGIFVAMGWSGQWGAIIESGGKRERLVIRCRVPGLEISLRPGEEIAGPGVLVGFYAGDQADGCNALRKLIREQFTPKLDGRDFEPVATYDHWWHVGQDFDAPLLKALADGAAVLGQEYFLLDAGWYRGAFEREGGGFAAGLGNWNEIDRTKLPDGLGSIASYVRGKGMKFGLWFEPERVAEGSQLAMDHPDWILWDHEEFADNWFWFREVCPDFRWPTLRYGLLDLGRHEAQAWVIDLIAKYIREYDVRYLRYDFNMDPLPYWRAHDAPGRRGLHQLRHVRGLYRVMDELRRQYPGTIFEGCASGGRRIDIEMARRFHTNWISDHTEDPAIIRYHLFGLNHFLPGNYHYAAFTTSGEDEGEQPLDDLRFQSLFGGAFGTGGRVDRLSSRALAHARKHVEVWKQIRGYLSKDFYALTPQPRDLASWSAWQFHDAERNEGFIQIFGGSDPQPNLSLSPRGLDPGASYKFSDAYHDDSVSSGVRVESGSLSLSLPPRRSVILRYKRA